MAISRKRVKTRNSKKSKKILKSDGVRHKHSLDRLLGYCVRCKSKSLMRNVNLTKSKRGTPMAKGFCTKCSTKMNMFMKA